MSENQDPVSAATLEVMQRHAETMATRDGDAIAADYAEDTVVFTAFFGEGTEGIGDGHEIVRGRQAIADWVEAYLPAFEKVAEGMVDNAQDALVRFRADGEYGHLVVDLGNGRHGTESYHVRDGKILFESATFFL